MKYIAILSLLLFSFSPIPAQDDAATKVIQLGNMSADKILEFEGEKVRVKGFVSETRSNATGIHFLEFKDSEFVCVTFARYVKEFEGGPPSELYKEQWIEVTGEIQNFRGKPQIVLTSPSMVKTIDAPPPVPDPEPVETTETADEPEKEMVEKTEPEPEPVVDPNAKLGKNGKPLEVINGVPAIDWRIYFPE